MASATVSDNRNVRSGSRMPYWLVLPGMLFLFVFFVTPLITLFKVALSERQGRGEPLDFNWNVSQFGDVFADFGGQFLRSLAFAGTATLLCILIGYPIAYFVVFKAGRFKTLLIGLVMVPFFTSFLLRTISWESMLNDQGIFVRFFEWSRLDGLLESLNIMQDGRLLRTPAAVIGGLTYNFLPFMLLPIYVSLEKVDPRLVDAAADLYSPFAATFRKVILPLSLPGVFAGTLLTFIPATGDFINAELLGDINSKRIVGAEVQRQFLDQNDYPTAAAISFVLMAIIVALVLVYTKFMGTEDLA